MSNPNRAIAALGPARVAAGVAAACGLLHLAVAGRVDLGVDEAHYALYGAMPDWSYFDHPPMVGWLQAVALAFSPEEAALRAWAIVLSLAAAWLVWQLTRELFPSEGRWTAAVAVLLLQSAVLFQVLSVGLVPDMPLLVFGLAAGWMLFRAIGGKALGPWLAVGLLFGLAGLSKYTAVTLVVTALGFALWQGRSRVLLGAGPWLAALVAAIVISPVIVWNAGHDWISFRYQLGHGAPDRAWSLARFMMAQAGQLLAYGPLLTLAGIAALASSRRALGEPGVRFSLSLALPVLLLFAWAGGYEETLPHWTLLGWAGLAPLTARWLVSAWPGKGIRRLTYAGATYSIGLTLLIHSLLWTPWVPFAPYRFPLQDLYGWREAALRAKALADDGAPVMVGNWTQASRIAWYARPREVKVIDGRFDQFDLWYGAPEAGEGGIVLTRGDGEGDSRLPAQFEQCVHLEQMIKQVNDTPVHRFDFYRCEGYRG